MRQAIIFDGDDTLWETQPIYRLVNEEFYALLEQQGFDPAEFRPLFTSINQSLLKTIQLSTDRLGRAMAATYEAMCQRAEFPSQPSIIDKLITLAGQVYLRAPQPMEGLHEVLSLLSQNFQLFFYSGGREDTQRKRLTQLGLDQYFQNRVFVVIKKDEATLGPILSDNNLDPQTTWIVGNSPKFEINPALRLGLNCIWMHTSFWEQDLEDILLGRTFVAFSLKEAANILMYGTGFGIQSYSATVSEAQEMQNLFSALLDRNEAWLVGSSPKLDINPALGYGVNVIWLPSNFNTSDREPIYGPVFVAFSAEGARGIITHWSNGNPDLAKVVWRLREREGNLGGSLVVE